MKRRIADASSSAASPLYMLEQTADAIDAPGNVPFPAGRGVTRPCPGPWRRSDAVSESRLADRSARLAPRGRGPRAGGKPASDGVPARPASAAAAPGTGGAAPGAPPWAQAEGGSRRGPRGRPRLVGDPHGTRGIGGAGARGGPPPPPGIRTPL